MGHTIKYENISGEAQSFTGFPRINAGEVIEVLENSEYDIALHRSPFMQIVQDEPTPRSRKKHAGRDSVDETETELG